LLTVTAFLVFAETYPSEVAPRAAVSEPAASTQVRAEKSPYSIDLNFGLSADLGLDKTIWLTDRDAMFSLRNNRNIPIEIVIDLSFQYGVCKTPRSLAITTTGNSRTLNPAEPNNNSLRWSTLVQPMSSERVALTVDGLPCLFNGDPRIFFGAVLIQSREL
jgi:hypothetical protein